jgi:hypothetical protein
VAADQAAVPGDRGSLPQADGGQQHRDDGLRGPDRTPRGRLVPLDRRAPVATRLPSASPPGN